MKTVLITGASSGFGLLTTKLLLLRGCRVFAGIRNLFGKNKAIADDLVHWSSDKIGMLTLCEMDVTNDQQVQHVAKLIEDTVGTVDVLINNAGVWPVGQSECFTEDQFRNILDINLLGIHRTCRAIIPLMRKHKKGLIIHMSSQSARIASPFLGLYASTKAAGDMLMEAMKYELKPFGINIVIVQPGTYQTGLFNNALTPADEARKKEYGAFSHIESGIVSYINQSFSQITSRPEEVAEQILKIIQTNGSGSETRVVIDPHPSAGIRTQVELINNISEKVTEKIALSMNL